jgi:hypothetical protein
MLLCQRLKPLKLASENLDLQMLGTHWLEIDLKTPG